MAKNGLWRVKKADAMLDEGDLDGAAVWRRIVAAINDFQREEPVVGERRH